MMSPPSSVERCLPSLRLYELSSHWEGEILPSTPSSLHGVQDYVLSVYQYVQLTAPSPLLSKPLGYCIWQILLLKVSQIVFAIHPKHHRIQALIPLLPCFQQPLNWCFRCQPLLLLYQRALSKTLIYFLLLKTISSMNTILRTKKTTSENKNNPSVTSQFL